MALTTPARPRTAAAPAPRRTTTSRTRRRLAQAGVLIGLLIGAVFAAGPVLWMLSSSFKSNTQIFELPPRLITDTFSSTRTVDLHQPRDGAVLHHSYVVAGAVTILTLLVAIQAAYAFSRFEFRGKRIVNVIIVSVQRCRRSRCHP